jgi:hypothetical protein
MAMFSMSCPAHSCRVKKGERVCVRIGAWQWRGGHGCNCVNGCHVVSPATTRAKRTRTGDDKGGTRRQTTQHTAAQHTAVKTYLEPIVDLAAPGKHGVTQHDSAGHGRGGRGEEEGKRSGGDTHDYGWRRVVGGLYA